jgi:hypothetical protein
VERAGQALNPARLGRLTLAVAARPALWLTALRQVLVLARPRWWRSSPRLPLPDDSYLSFRLQTMYGDAAHDPEPGDLVTYLEWVKRTRRGH